MLCEVLLRGTLLYIGPFSVVVLQWQAGFSHRCFYSSQHLIDQRANLTFQGWEKGSPPKERLRSDFPRSARKQSRSEISTSTTRKEGTATSKPTKSDKPPRQAKCHVRHPFPPSLGHRHHPRAGLWHLRKAWPRLPTFRLSERNNHVCIRRSLCRMVSSNPADSPPIDCLLEGIG